MESNILNKKIRAFALTLLDTPHGIELDAYLMFVEILKATNNEDIIEKVDQADHVAFICEDFAEEELAKLKEDEEDKVDVGVDVGVGV